MKVRRIADLAQVPDADFITLVAEGARLSLANAERLYADAASARTAGARRGYLVLHGAAGEEASKVLILLDAVRCPTSEPEARSRQLKKFIDHLARMIYCHVADHRPATYGEITDSVERLREAYYLDGPSGFDWIYRNRLLQEREGAMYVDYVEAEDGRRWEVPNETLAEMLTLGSPIPPASLSIARHLAKVGTLEARGMSIVAEVWRGLTPVPGTPYATFRNHALETLRRLGADGLGSEAEAADAAAVRDNWLFPLWPLDMKLHEVRFEDLQAARTELAERYPEGY